MSVNSLYTVMMGIKDVGKRLERELIQKQLYFDFVVLNVSVMVWQCLSIYGVGHLVVIDESVNQFTFLGGVIEDMFGDR